MSFNFGSSAGSAQCGRSADCIIPAKVMFMINGSEYLAAEAAKGPTHSSTKYLFKEHVSASLHPFFALEDTCGVSAMLSEVSKLSQCDSQKVVLSFVALGSSYMFLNVVVLPQRFYEILPEVSVLSCFGSCLTECFFSHGKILSHNFSRRGAQKHFMSLLRNEA